MMIAAAKDFRLVHVVDARAEDYANLMHETSDTELRFQFFGAGRDALRCDASTPPNLWVVNIHLPDMSGTDLLEMLRWCFPGARWRW